MEAKFEYEKSNIQYPSTKIKDAYDLSILRDSSEDRETALKEALNEVLRKMY